MLNRLRRLFEGPVSEVTDSDLQQASAVLLIEVAMADHAFSNDEERQLRQLLCSQYGLSVSDVDELVRAAREAASHQVSLHRQIDLINEHYGPDRKLELMRALWDMAYADGELHHYEEHLIRRLADLLYVPHRDFIRLKHQSSKR